MKLRIEREELACHLEPVSRVGLVKKKTASALPILDTVLLEVLEKAEGGYALRLSATNLQVMLELEITKALTVFEPGSICLPRKLFSDIVGDLPGSLVELSTTLSFETEVSCGNYSGIIKGFDPLDFPVFSNDLPEGNHLLSLPASVLKSSASGVSFAASHNEDRQPILTCINLKAAGEQLKLAALDGFRGAVRTVKTGEAGSFEANIPSQYLTLLAQTLPDSPGEIELGLNDKGTCLVARTRGSERYRFSASLLEGKYPNYEKVFPQHPLTSLSLEVKELLAAAEAVGHLMDSGSDAGYGSSKHFWLEIIPSQKQGEPGTLVVAGESELGRSSQQLLARVEGEGVLIYLQQKYLAEALRQVEGKQVTLELAGGDKPFVLREEGGGAGGEFRAFVLPLTTNHKPAASAKQKEPQDLGTAKQPLPREGVPEQAKPRKGKEPAADNQPLLPAIPKNPDGAKEPTAMKDIGKPERVGTLPPGEKVSSLPAQKEARKNSPPAPTPPPTNPAQEVELEERGFLDDLEEFETSNAEEEYEEVGRLFLNLNRRKKANFLLGPD